MAKKLDTNSLIEAKNETYKETKGLGREVGKNNHTTSHPYYGIHRIANVKNRDLNFPKNTASTPSTPTANPTIRIANTGVYRAIEQNAMDGASDKNTDHVKTKKARIKKPILVLNFGTTIDETNLGIKPI